MDKDLIQALLPVVNDPGFNNVLKKYVEHRVDYYKNALCSAKSMEEVSSYQGSIRELQRFFSLQDEVRQKAKELKQLRGGDG